MKTITSYNHSFVTHVWLYREIIRFTRRIAKVVFLIVQTNKILLFIQIWHYLVIFFKKKIYSCANWEFDSHICIVIYIILLAGRITSIVLLVDLIISQLYLMKVRCLSLKGAKIGYSWYYMIDYIQWIRSPKLVL